MGPIVRALGALVCSFVVLVPPALAQGPVQYFYDDLGRLVGVIDPAGNAATYVYDAVGNLLSIQRYSASSVSIITLSPGTGPVGATVLISGTGFSTTPAQNAVTFNGAPATVSSATATQLIVEVPAGATTGTIGITAPAGSATSSGNFVVTATNGAPTITSFTPTTGPAGTPVTITGTNFSTVLPNDKTRFNVGYTPPSSATATTIAAAVPPATGSGHISVSTPFGTAVSTGDFIVPPSSLAVADVESASRFPFGTATAVDVAAAAKIALRLFDATAGQRVSLKGTNGVTGHYFGCDISVSILDADNEPTHAGATCMEGSGFIDATTIRKTGTYTIFVDPGDTVTGGVTLTLYDIPADTGGPIALDGPPETVTMSTPGQNGGLTFAGLASGKVSVVGTNAISGQIGLVCDVNVSLRAPDGSTVAGPACMEGSGFIDATTLPVNGTYTIYVDPTNAALGSLTATAYSVVDVTGTLATDGTPSTVAMMTPGQNAVLTFSGTAGHEMSLKGTNGLHGQILGCDVNARILNPDGSVLAADACMENAGFISPVTLPSTGTYAVVVDPVSYATGNVTLALYDVPADSTGPITPGGSPVTVTIDTPGANAALTFSGTANQRISLRGTNGTIIGQFTGCDVNVRILKPDAGTLVSDTCMEGNGYIDVQTLPVTGTYTNQIDPVSYQTGNLTLTLYDVPADAGGTLVAGGSAVTLTMATPGQNGALTFSGTSGDRISLQGTNGLNGQIFFACDVNVSILKPDGSTLAASTCMETSGFIDVQTLPVSGTYTVKVDPVQFAVGSLTLTLHAVPPDPTTVLTVNGPSSPLTISTPGQNATATFSGTSSQQVTVHLTGNSIGSTTVRLLKPDGSQLTSATSSAASFNLPAQTLPVTGTYTIVVDPGGAGIGSITVNVTNP
jgi:YD repeat-containing protein